MRKFTLLVLFVMIASVFSFAQMEVGKMSVDVAPEIAMPIGDFGDFAAIGFGATARFNYVLMENLVLTGSAGYIMYTEELDGVSVSAIPFKAGAKYFFMPDMPVYGGLELGMTMFTVDVDNFGDNDETEFMIAPAIGYEYKLNEKMSLDASARYEFNADYSQLGFRVGFNFGL